MKIKILLYTLVSLMEVMVVAQTKSHPAMSTHATASQIHDRAENYNLINLACPGNVTVNNDAGQCQANVVLPDYDVSGNAIAFDGTNDYLSATLPTVFAAIGTTDFTVETWVNPSSHGSSRRVFFAQYDQSNFMTILINSSGVVYVFVQNNATVYSTNTQTVAPLNQWTHIAFRWVASTKAIEVLINGTLAPSISGGSSSSGTNNRMTIGSRSDGMQVFSGKIDEFRIWNTLRSNSEIVGSMATCVPEASTGLIAYYHFDETSGSLTAADATGNGYDCTLNNMDSSTVWTNGTITCGASAVNDYTGTNNASGTYPIGDTTVNWTIDDGQGNISNCTQIVTVTDAEDPVITCPGAVTLNAAAGQCTATASIGTATATDNCGSPTVTNDAPTAFPIGTTTVTWTATDGAGNTATCMQIVTVTDVEDPVITCPGAITLNAAAGQCTATASIGTATATDNCGSPTVTNDAPTAFPIGITTVTWTATDGAGNTATCTQVVTVTDVEDPVITCPGAITLNAAAGQCTATASIGTATATDNCGSPTVTNDAPTAFPIGTTTVTWTATDGAGNTATCTQVVTVTDAEDPVITCPGAVTLNAAAGQCTATASIGTATATDNCGTPTVTNDAPTAFPIGTTTVTWTATDGAGNTATCTQVVTVTDVEDPVITCPGAITFNTDAGQCTATASIGTATATDNCGSPTVTNDAPTAFPIGTTTVTWTATDGAGNTATCTQVVTVTDVESPVAIAQDITVSLDASGNATLTPAMIDNGSSDNCTIASWQLDRTSFDCSDIGTPVTVILTITDGVGNSDSTTALVTVEDTIDPVVITQDITVQLDNSGSAFITPEMIDNGSYDNCGIVSMSLDMSSFNCPGLDEAEMVTLTLTDASGNSSQAHATVSFTGPDRDMDHIADPCDAEQNPDITPILGLSPNNDGQNDTWVIENITNYPQAKIEVFDRNGVAVFHTVNYQNDWDGRRNGTGDLVPVGSYFYSIDVFGDASLYLKGWLYINY